MRHFTQLPCLSLHDRAELSLKKDRLDRKTSSWAFGITASIGTLSGLFFNWVYASESWIEKGLLFGLAGLLVLALLFLLGLFVCNVFEEEIKQWDPIERVQQKWAKEMGFESWQELSWLSFRLSPMGVEKSTELLKQCVEANLTESPEFQVCLKYREALGYWPLLLEEMKIKLQNLKQAEKEQELKSIEGLIQIQAPNNPAVERQTVFSPMETKTRS